MSGEAIPQPDGDTSRILDERSSSSGPPGYFERVVVITGAGRGIGAATALRAARAGYAVCVNFRSDEAGALSVVHEIRRTAGLAEAVQADISSEAGVEALFAQTMERFGRIDALVNNAGILAPQQKLEEMELRRVRTVFDTNFFGAFLCMREAIRHMSTARGGSGGSIVNVSSIAARTGAPGEYVDYAASKAAMDAMTKGVAREVAEQGIRVNGVRPGFIYTEMHASGGEPDRVDRIKDQLPMRRGGRPEEVAAAVLWLLSDEASFTTGSFIEVTGGK